MIKYVKASPDANGFMTDEELDAYVSEQKAKRDSFYEGQQRAAEKSSRLEQARAKKSQLEQEAQDKRNQMIDRFCNEFEQVASKIVPIAKDILDIDDILHSVRSKDGSKNDAYIFKKGDSVKVYVPFQGYPRYSYQVCIRLMDSVRHREIDVIYNITGDYYYRSFDIGHYDSEIPNIKYIVQEYDKKHIRDIKYSDYLDGIYAAKSALESELAKLEVELDNYLADED